MLFNVVLEIAITRPKVELRGTTFDQCSQIMDMLMILREED